MWAVCGFIRRVYFDLIVDLHRLTCFVLLCFDFGFALVCYCCGIVIWCMPVVGLGLLLSG